MNNNWCTITLGTTHNYFHMKYHIIVTFTDKSVNLSLDYKPICYNIHDDVGSCKHYNKWILCMIYWMKISSNFLNTGLVSGIKVGVFVEAYLCVKLIPNKIAMILV